MSYKDNFKTRNKRLVAEDMCVAYLKENNIIHTRYGFDCLFDIKPKDFMKIPEKLRYTPDYMVIKAEAYLLEAKGCHDILRLKTDDMKSYNFWDNLVKLYVFVYSTMERSHKIISYEKLSEIAYTCAMDYYEDNGKAYYKIPWELIR